MQGSSVRVQSPDLTDEGERGAGALRTLKLEPYTLGFSRVLGVGCRSLKLVGCRVWKVRFRV